MSSMASFPKRPVRYFISYTRDDDKLPESLVKELSKQLGASRDYDYQPWRDTGILVGKSWEVEIKAALEACDFGLLLVSPSFLGKKYITEQELPVFVRGEKPCVPVPLCRIDFEDQDLKGLDEVQFFSFTTAAGNQSRSFEECTTDAEKSAFAHKLFKAITARLDDLFASHPWSGTTAVKPVSTIRESDYRVHLRKHYSYLQLEALASDTIYRDIQLQQVFIPQDVRDCGAWLPEKLESPAKLTLEEDSDFSFAELDEQKRFRESPPRRIYDVMDPPAARCRVLLGAPGAGKSSFTRICLLRWLTEGQGTAGPLPILIELRLFNRSQRTDFLDYLENDKDVIFRFPREELDSLLTAGAVQLIFDGLDEIFDPSTRATIVRLIVRYAESYTKVRILVTSRLVGYFGSSLRDAGFLHWLLADFNDEKIGTFLDRWTTDAIREPSDRPIVRDRIESALRSPVIRELAANPMLLTLMAVLARKSDLPRDLASLYARAADLLLEQWDAHRMLASDVALGSVLIDQKDKHDLLRDLAWKMQTGQRRLRGNLISESEVRAAMDVAFEHRIPDPGLRRKAITLLIEKLIERNYILCHVGGAQFAFVHRGFLEFFCAEKIKQLCAEGIKPPIETAVSIFQERGLSDAWIEVLVLAAVSLPPLSPTLHS